MEPDPELEPPHVADDGEGQRPGLSPKGTAANVVIRALSRAARSFLLYEPTNEAIRIFLEGLRDAANAYIDTHGALELEIRPFEILDGLEVVYLDRDRERSLAFRLYRDGVRRLTLDPGLPWNDLLKLLSVLSIRYIGVRHTEEDLVVLLWKAGFTHIRFEAVEGFVADTDDEVDARPQGPTKAIDAPGDFDLPVPARKRFAGVEYHAVSPLALHELLAEDEAARVPQLAARLCDALLTARADQNSPITLDAITPHLIETRDFLFSDGQLQHAMHLANRILDTTQDTSDSLVGESIVAGFVTSHTLRRYLNSLPRDARTPPDEIVQALDTLPGDHLRALVEVLRTEQTEGPRRLARQLLERAMRGRIDEIVDMITQAPSALACELLRTLRYVDAQRATTAAIGLVNRPELDVQLQLLHTLGALPPTADAGRVLAALSAAEAPEVRFEAMKLARERRTPGVFGPLAARLKREAVRLDDTEVETMGLTLAILDPASAVAVFRDWCKPKGLFGGVVPGLYTLQRGAVAGLVEIDGEEAEKLIRAVIDQAGSALADWCGQAMVRRRRRMRGQR